MLFYAVLPDFGNGIAFSKVPRFRPFGLLVGATCRLRWVWSTRWMILTRENRSARSKPSPSARLSATNVTWIDLGSNPGLRDERLTTNRLSWYGHSDIKINRSYMYSCSSYRPVNALRLGYKKHLFDYVQGSNCLFCDPYRTYKCPLWAECRSSECWTSWYI